MSRISPSKDALISVMAVFFIVNIVPQFLMLISLGENNVAVYIEAVAQSGDSG